ncbi:MAG: aspartate aminotransferase family protein [Bacteroidetes bacterium 4572_117]|nr:MAG: aspartate aminotransferase family protein [Bacteroidetes bacterium 4572_117]
MSFFPKNKTGFEDVLNQMQDFGKNDSNWRDGKTWSLVYHAGNEHSDFIKKAYSMYFTENALNPMAFKSLKRFEHEVVRMSAEIFHGAGHAVGTMSSGGTESILLAVKTYRDMANAKKGLIRLPKAISPKPEMIVPESVHVAFTKAAHYFGVKLVVAPLDKQYRVKVKAVKKLINRNTILIVGSAPNYPFGTVDPIEELGQLAERKNIPLHVDACLGGFLLPFIEKNGGDIPLFDFRVKGVSSISADIHKYGFAAKGASVILYRDMSYLKHQFFAEENWPGGMFVSPALLGTRPGGAIAAAWASLTAQGEDGLKEKAALVMKITKQIQEGIKLIKQLEINGEPEAGIFSYRSVDEQINIYAVADILEEKGWHTDRQQKPECLHVMITPAHENVVENYLQDLKEAISIIKQSPEKNKTGNAAMYGMMANIPFRGMIKKELLKVMEEMYSVSGETPTLDNQGQNDLKTIIAQKFLDLRAKFKIF